MNPNWSPKLSICIATLNRASFIGKTLDTIIPYAGDDVEIVIVDGASTDNTEDVIREYRKRFSRITYVRLAEKGGVDADYDRSVQEAQGEYCWLFTDDDLLRPGAIAAVLEAISHKPAIVVVNAEVFDRDVAQSLQPKRLSINSNISLLGSQLDDLLKIVRGYLSFIGAVVIRRDLWLDRERKRYYGTEFIHVGVIFQAALPAGITILAYPHIKIRFGNAQWRAREFEILMFKWPKLIWSFMIVSEEAKARIVAQEPWSKFKGLIAMRAKRSYSPAIFRQFIVHRELPLITRIKCKAAASIPVFLARLLCLVFLSLFRRRESIREIRYAYRIADRDFFKS